MQLNVGEYINRTRQAKQYRIQDLVANLKISAGTYNRIINGQKELQAEQYLQIMSQLGVDIHDSRALEAIDMASSGWLLPLRRAQELVLKIFHHQTVAAEDIQLVLQQLATPADYVQAQYTELRTTLELLLNQDLPDNWQVAHQLASELSQRAFLTDIDLTAAIGISGWLTSTELEHLVLRAEFAEQRSEGEEVPQNHTVMQPCQYDVVLKMLYDRWLMVAFVHGSFEEVATAVRNYQTQILGYYDTERLVVRRFLDSVALYFKGDRTQAAAQVTEIVGYLDTVAVTETPYVTQLIRRLWRALLARQDDPEAATLCANGHGFDASEAFGLPHFTTYGDAIDYFRKTLEIGVDDFVAAMHISRARYFRLIKNESPLYVTEVARLCQIFHQTTRNFYDALSGSAVLANTMSISPLYNRIALLSHQFEKDAHATVDKIYAGFAKIKDEIHDQLGPSPLTTMLLLLNDYSMYDQTDEVEKRGQVGKKLLQLVSKFEDWNSIEILTISMVLSNDGQDYEFNFALQLADMAARNSATAAGVIYFLPIAYALLCTAKGSGHTSKADEHQVRAALARIADEGDSLLLQLYYQYVGLVFGAWQGDDGADAKFATMSHDMKQFFDEDTFAYSIVFLMDEFWALLVHDKCPDRQRR